MKFIATFAALIVCTMAQRPSYAGTGPIGRPSLASRFQDTAESTTVAVSNRVGDATTTTQRIPVDALGDGELVNRLNQWPREHRPFWLLNAEHIEAARNPTAATGNQQRNPTAATGNQQQQGIQNRNTFFGDASDESRESIPIRPSVQRSSFLPPLDRTT